MPPCLEAYLGLGFPSTSSQVEGTGPEDPRPSGRASAQPPRLPDPSLPVVFITLGPKAQRGPGSLRAVLQKRAKPQDQSSKLRQSDPRNIKNLDSLLTFEDGEILHKLLPPRAPYLQQTGADAGCPFSLGLDPPNRAKPHQLASVTCVAHLALRAFEFETPS